MTFSDLAITSLGNLWRMKLRTFLTVSGVVVAIAAFVSMLSFGVGMQENVARQFDDLGLLSIIQVYPSRSDTTETVPLDRTALGRFASLSGVELVYPYESFDIKVSYGDSTVKASAQALPAEALDTRMFSNLLVGSKITSDTSREIMIGDDMLEKLGVDSAEAVVGTQIVLSVEVATVDSGIAGIFTAAPERIGERFRSFKVDSLRSQDYWRRVVREEFSGAIGRFVDGFMNKRRTIADTLTVCGVLDRERRGHLRMGDLIIPISTAQKFNAGGFSGDPTQLLSAAQGGHLFTPEADSSSDSFSRATVKIATDALYQPIRDSIQAAGFRAVSFAEEFDEIRRFFRYFNLALGMVGIIALFTASLGIVNTMVMSITERRREIGVWMSLGADVWDIRRLYLIESGFIGIIGACGGIIIGWGISRIASLIVRTFMENEGVTPMELFAVPIWLVLTALSFGLVVALIAGYYPANRAARTDPVSALRNE